MNAIVEADATGLLQLQVKPHARYRVEATDLRIVLSPAESSGRPPFARLAPRERAEEFARWAASHPDGPGLPDHAVGRDAIYE